MMISVVIPTKNRPLDVEETLDTLLNQSLKPCEVIFADDSTDSATKELIEKYRGTYSSKNIELRHVWDSGSLARARTLGGLISSGEIIVYMDDDLIIKNDTVEILVKTLERTEAMAVWGNIYFQDSRRSRLIKFLENPYYRFIFGRIRHGGGLFAVRRKVLEDRVWFDHNLDGYSLYEDKDFACNLHKHYGSRGIVQVENPTLALNKGTLIKSEKYYASLFGGTIYFSKKWGGTTHLIAAVPLTLFLCGFHMISEGGRGKSAINKKEIVEACLNVLKNLKTVLNGKFDPV
jgi:glycosyltransferase involved in cell wall biosynthesis